MPLSDDDLIARDRWLYRNGWWLGLGLVTAFFAVNLGLNWLVHQFGGGWTWVRRVWPAAFVLTTLALVFGLRSRGRLTAEAVVIRRLDELQDRGALAPLYALAPLLIFTALYMTLPAYRFLGVPLPLMAACVAAIVAYGQAWPRRVRALIEDEVTQGLRRRALAQSYPLAVAGFAAASVLGRKTPGDDRLVIAAFVMAAALPAGLYALAHWRAGRA